MSQNAKALAEYATRAAIIEYLSAFGDFQAKEKAEFKNRISAAMKSIVHPPDDGVCEFDFTPEEEREAMVIIERNGWNDLRKASDEVRPA